MKKQLRKPENWQDFESLCKILWGEIWNCPEIKKNGRNGQQQHGVDVYGIPEKETQYYGIQCKGKDDYTNSELTKLEIDLEIIKAKEFKPALKKFYFATTANKDAKIEEYVRLKNEVSIKSFGFEIHLFSWEDIVDLIDENKRTHDWFLNNIDFKSRHSVKISFNTGESHLIFSPVLIKNHITYKTKEYQKSGNSLFLPPLHRENYEDRIKLTESQPIRYYFNGMTTNKSACVFAIMIKNDGSLPLEHFKMLINFKGNLVVDTVDKRNEFLDPIKHRYNTHILDDSNNFIFEPLDHILVQTDSILTDKICLRPTIEESQDVLVEYEFIAKDFNTKGILTIRLENIVKETQTTQDLDLLHNKVDEIRLENCLE